MKKKRPDRSIVICLAWLLIFALPGCSDQAQLPMSSHLDVMKVNHAEVWSKGRVELIPQLYTDDFVGHFPGGETVLGRDGIRATVEAHRTAFPDWTETIVHFIEDGDLVVTMFQSFGTNQGAFRGRPATGNIVEILEACVFRMVDGQIAEQWTFPDIASLQTQLASQ